MEKNVVSEKQSNYIRPHLKILKDQFIVIRGCERTRTIYCNFELSTVLQFPLEMKSSSLAFSLLQFALSLAHLKAYNCNVFRFFNLEKKLRWP